MKAIIMTLLLSLTASLSHAQSILRLDTANAFGGACHDAICFDGMLGQKQIGVMIVDGQLSFVDEDEDGNGFRVFLEKAQPCADSDSDPEGAREFFIDLEKGIWSDEAKPVRQCQEDLLS